MDIRTLPLEDVMKLEGLPVELTDLKGDSYEGVLHICQNGCIFVLTNSITGSELPPNEAYALRTYDCLYSWLIHEPERSLMEEYERWLYSTKSVKPLNLKGVAK